jgi:hypothetical protein
VGASPGLLPSLGINTEEAEGSPPERNARVELTERGGVTIIFFGVNSHSFVPCYSATPGIYRPYPGRGKITSCPGHARCFLEEYRGNTYIPRSRSNYSSNGAGNSIPRGLRPPYPLLAALKLALWGPSPAIGACQAAFVLQRHGVKVALAEGVIITLVEVVVEWVGCSLGCGKGKGGRGFWQRMSLGWGGTSSPRPPTRREYSINSK